MTEKSSEYVRAIEGLTFQLKLAQDMIISIYENNTLEEATQIINEILLELEPEKAHHLRMLITAMQAEAMGDAGKNIH